MAFTFSATGYGEIAKAGAFKVAQTGGKVSKVAGQAVTLLQSGDSDGFRKLLRKSRKLRVSMTRHHFSGDLTEIAVGVSYGHASLGAIQVPGETWMGMNPYYALEAVGMNPYDAPETAGS